MIDNKTIEYITKLRTQSDEYIYERLVETNNMYNKFFAEYREYFHAKDIEKAFPKSTFKHDFDGFKFNDTYIYYIKSFNYVSNTVTFGRIKMWEEPQ